MQHIKSKAEIGYFKKSGEIATAAIKHVLANVKIGVTTLELDKMAEDKIYKLGGEISFKTVESYPFTICTTVNDEVVHGLPSEYRLKLGDIIGIDLGAIYHGCHTDVAETVAIGNVEEKFGRFLTIGKKTLQAAYQQAILGNRIGDISFTIQSNIESAGYSVVRELIGHGVGKALHEDPIIPGIGKPNTGPKIEKGMTLAIEIIYSMGKPDVIYKNNDGWTIVTKDGSLAGLFERTVLVTDNEPIVLTPID